MNYYSEWDRFKCDWISNLVASGVIPSGFIDARSIAEITAKDLLGYRQVHLFCGIAGWSEALRLAGFSARRKVWTLSCPCQPFSVAGKGEAENDTRHLWPEARRLIAECNPSILFGEQTQSPLGLEWFSRVRSDLEELGYVVGASDLCAASIAAPHRRQRIYFGAVRLANSEHDAGRAEHVAESWRRTQAENNATECCGTCGMADSANGNRGPGEFGAEEGTGTNELGRIGSGKCLPADRMGNSSGDNERRTLGDAWNRTQLTSGGPSTFNRMGDSISTRLEGHSGDESTRDESGRICEGPAGSTSPTSPWSDSYVIDCLDGKKRRLSATDVPLAAGIPRDLGFLESDVRKLATGARRNRKGRLHGYGDSIVPPLAALFIEVFLESVSDLSSESTT